MAGTVSKKVKIHEKTTQSSVKTMKTEPGEGSLTPGAQSSSATALPVLPAKGEGLRGDTDPDPQAEETSEAVEKAETGVGETEQELDDYPIPEDPK